MAKKPQTTQLPTTINIPGGKASFFTDKDIPPRREREVEMLQLQLNPKKLRALQQAAKIFDEEGGIGDDSPLLDGPDATMTADEAKLFLALGETTAWAYLKSWTLRAQEGEATVPRPLPATPDDFLDLPKGIYDALTEHGSKIAAQKIDDGFGVDNAGDESSPTTA